MILQGFEMYAVDGNPVVQATVKLYAATLTQPNAGTLLASTTTDAQGFWQFTGLADGDYDVKVEVPGESRVKWYKGLTRAGFSTSALTDGNILVGGTTSNEQVDLDTLRLTNEIKNWPPYVPDNSDLHTLNLWWRQVGTPTIKPTVVDVAGAGLTPTYAKAIKCQAAAANDGFKQTWTYADEPRAKSGRKMSGLFAIWCAGGVGVTAKFVNSDATHTDAPATTSSSWTVVEIKGHTLAGTSCDLQFIASGAGTFYVVPLGTHIGTRGFQLAPRGLKLVDLATAPEPVSSVDTGGVYTTVDVTSGTSPLTVAIQALFTYLNSTTAGKTVSYRRKGLTNTISVVLAVTTGAFYLGNAIVTLDDGQQFEVRGSDVAGNTEQLYIDYMLYWEWE
jgi:hypothetical protein